MAEPELVAECVAAMGEASALPVTVKCRIGIDDQDAEESLDRFIDQVAQAGCRTFIVHARKAWLKGLSPKENRDVPPLDYERVYRLEAAPARPRDRRSMAASSLSPRRRAHLPHVDGVMLGRAAYADPYLLAEVDRALFGSSETPPSRLEVLDRFMPYVEAELAAGARLNQMTRHILGLFHGQPRARAFRRHLAENAHLDGAGIEVLKAARRIVAGEERWRSPPSSALTANPSRHAGHRRSTRPNLCPAMTNPIHAFMPRLAQLGSRSGFLRSARAIRPWTSRKRAVRRQ